MSNARTAMRRQFAKSILTEKALLNLRERAESGDLAPQEMTLLLHYLLGKPTEEIEHFAGNNDLMEASTEQLLAAAREIEARLAERVEADKNPPPDTGSMPPPPAGPTPVSGGGSVH